MTKTSKRIVLLGKGDLAVDAGRWFTETDGFTLEAVVPVIPEPGWTRSLSTWAIEHQIPCVQSGDYYDLPRLVEGGWRPDLVVSIFYDRIIKEDFIRRCHRIVNLHNAPLPKYRGVSPINWALKNGETQHGVTIHDITPGVDDGPIISQVSFSIYPDIDEVVDVYQRCLLYGRILFETTMPIIDRIQPQAQDESEATYYGRKDDHRLGDRRLFTRQESSRSV